MSFAAKEKAYGYEQDPISKMNEQQITSLLRHPSIVASKNRRQEIVSRIIENHADGTNILRNAVQLLRR